jgi:hypothetical protein
MSALEDGVVADYAQKLRDEGMPEQIVARLVAVYRAEHLPMADTLARAAEIDRGADRIEQGYVNR